MSESGEKSHKMNIKFAREGFDLFVTGFSYRYDEEDLRSMFEVYGPVVSVVILLGKGGQKSGVAFVKFDDEKSGRDAIQGLNETIHDGRKIFVEVSKPHNSSSPRRSHKYPDQPPEQYSDDEI